MTKTLLQTLLGTAAVPNLATHVLARNPTCGIVSAPVIRHPLDPTDAAAPRVVPSEALGQFARDPEESKALIGHLQAADTTSPGAQHSAATGSPW